MKKSGKNSLKENNYFDDPLAGDLSELMEEADWQVAKFELTKPKTETITMRVSKELLKAIKSEAKKRGLDYTKYSPSRKTGGVDNEVIFFQQRGGRTKR